MVTPFQGIGGTSLQGSVTYVLRICVTDVLRGFCYLCPGVVQGCPPGMLARHCSAFRYCESDNRENLRLDVVAEFASAAWEGLELRLLTPLLDCVLAVPRAEREKAPRVRCVLDKMA